MDGTVNCSGSRGMSHPTSDTGIGYYDYEQTAAFVLKSNHMGKSDFVEGEKIKKAHAVRRVEPIFEKLARSLAEISELSHIKIFSGRIAASNRLSQDRKKNPVVKIGAEGITGVELLIDTTSKVIQFYSITSALKGHGRQMVGAVVSATPEDWVLAVVFDWSDGFWQKMIEEHPRIVVL